MLVEKEFKFDLFTQKISARPDLIILNKKDLLNAEIWDFKTGSFDEISKEKYFLQLTVYGYGLFQVFQELESICLKVVSLDCKEVQELVLTKSELNDRLSAYSKKLNSPHLKNENFCPKCPYSSICLAN